jgi:hypothetical protein
VPLGQQAVLVLFGRRFAVCRLQQFRTFLVQAIEQRDGLGHDRQPRLLVFERTNGRIEVGGKALQLGLEPLHLGFGFLRLPNFLQHRGKFAELGVQFGLFRFILGKCLFQCRQLLAGLLEGMFGVAARIGLAGAFFGELFRLAARIGDSTFLGDNDADRREDIVEFAKPGVVVFDGDRVAEQ